MKTKPNTTSLHRMLLDGEKVAPTDQRLVGGRWKRVASFGFRYRSELHHPHRRKTQ